jgi:hypothetical protein
MRGCSSSFSDSNRLGGCRRNLIALTYELTARCSTKLSYAGTPIPLKPVCNISFFVMEPLSLQFFGKIFLYDVVESVSGEGFKLTFLLLPEKMLDLRPPRFALAPGVLHHILQSLHVDV